MFQFLACLRKPDVIAPRRTLGGRQFVVVRFTGLEGVLDASWSVAIVHLFMSQNFR